MRRDVKQLYDVMAETIGYTQVKMSAASLQLARIHVRSTHCARFARDEIINLLRSALREDLLTCTTLGKHCKEMLQFYFQDVSLYSAAR